MSGKRLTPVVHLVGPPGSGKTTLCRLLLDAFTDKSVLAVDGSAEQSLCAENPLETPPTLAALLERMQQTAMTREALDWTLQDLPVPAPAESECDVLALGALPETLQESQLDLMAYALPRLFALYDVVIWDGPFAGLASILKSLDSRPLIVITPDDTAYCARLAADSAFTHAMILLSKAQNHDALPASAIVPVHEGRWKLVGKLPPLTPDDRRMRELPQYFQDCFHKLDLPFELRS